MTGAVSDGDQDQQASSIKEDSSAGPIPAASKQSGVQAVPGSYGKDQSMATSPSSVQGEPVIYYPASGFSPPYYFDYNTSGYVGSPPAMTAGQWEYMRAMGASDPQEQTAYATNGSPMYIHSPPAFPSHMYSPQPFSFQPQPYSATTATAGAYLAPPTGADTRGGGDGAMLGQANGAQPAGHMGGGDGVVGKGGGGRGGYWQNGDYRMQHRMVGRVGNQNRCMHSYKMNGKGMQSGFRPTNGYMEYGQGRGGNGYTNGYHSNGYYNNGGGGRGWRGGFDKGGRGRGRNFIPAPPVHLYNVATEQNRGPRTLRGRGTNPAPVVLPGGVDPVKEYNLEGFETSYEAAKFFVIKSYSEDDVHKCIKYKMWASTANGNRKLSGAYNESQGVKGTPFNEAEEDAESKVEDSPQSCPIFLFFSVNASGQFCGVAEMVGPLDATHSCQYWQQDKWTGQFAVRWHLIKDVPNGNFREIRLANNENKPVTNSRDTQEVCLKQGMEMLSIFKSYEAKTSILDDFYYYDDREAKMQERRERQNGLKAQPQSKQVNKTQNGCSNSESEKEVEREKGDITEGEEADKGHLIISPEVVVGEERGAADEVVENVKKEKNEGGEPDSMIDTMASIKLSS